MSISIAYLFNWYPQPSLTALRREITAVEELGLSPHRFTIRPFTGQLVDENDLAERRRTRALLDAGVLGFLGAMVRVAVSRPRSFTRVLATAARMGRVEERGLVRTLIYFAEACLLLEWMDELKIDHLHTHFATNSATVAMLCRLLGGPTYSFTMHGPEEFDSPRGNSLAEKIHHARFVVAICEFTRSQLYRWADYHDWARIHVIHVGVSPLFLEHGPAPIPTAPRLVNIARIVEQKGQVILVQAAARLRDRGLDFELVIVGDGPMRGEIERLIGHYKLEQRVRITGYLSNQGVRDELLAARALVLPSFAEGLPAVFFESLALGRPVITTYIAGHPELIEAGKNGWLVPAGAVEPLVDAMAEVVQADPATLEQMGRAGARAVAERHDFHKEARKLIELFQGA
jgi:glycosyltransferase involved in cell wall biosynthesis